MVSRPCGPQSADIGLLRRTNSFMDRMNDDFFRPRGLYCLIMAYNPTTMPGKETPDPVQAMASHDRSSSSTARGFPSKAKQNLRSPAAGTSQGEAGLPDSVAKLVHPDIVDATVHRDSNSATKKKAFARLNNYFDRRAQARYVSLNNIFSRVVCRNYPVQT